MWYEARLYHDEDAASFTVTFHVLRCATQPCADGDEAPPTAVTFTDGATNHIQNTFIDGELDPTVDTNDVIALGAKTVTNGPKLTIYHGYIHIYEIGCGGRGGN